MERKPLKYKKPKYLKMDELKDGYLYRIIARNARYGIWRAENEDFFISRVKFGDNYIFEEFHWDADSGWGGTAKPLEELEKYPEGQDMLEYLNLWEERGREDQERELQEYLNRKR